MVRAEQGKEDYQIRIRFRGFAARIVAERRWHPSQEVHAVEEDGSVIDLSMRLSALEDIARWVLGFGSQVEVLEPKELLEKVVDELRKAASQYEKPE